MGQLHRLNEALGAWRDRYAARCPAGLESAGDRDPDRKLPFSQHPPCIPSLSVLAGSGWQGPDIGGTGCQVRRLFSTRTISPWLGPEGYRDLGAEQSTGKEIDACLFFEGLRAAPPWSH